MSVRSFARASIRFRHPLDRVRVLAVAATLAATFTPSAAFAQASPATPAPAPAAQPFTAGFQDGFALQTANGDNRLAFGLLVQTDGRFSIDDVKPFVNTFTLRRARPSLQGRIAKYFDFKLTPDLGSGTATVVDAYFDTRFSAALRVRVGKDKTPLGMEVLQADPGLLFPERSLVSSLVPNRDVGVQVQGDVAAARVSYAFGVFDGVPDGASSTTDVDVNNGKDVAGRLALQPFKTTKTPAPALNGLGLQIGASNGKQTGALPSFKTSAGQTYLSYAAVSANAPASVAGGNRTRVSPGAYYYYKSFGAFGEYVQSSQDVSRGATTATVANTGWDVSATVVLTGEAASAGVIRPKRPFDPPTRAFGAIQLVARYAELAVDEDAFDSGLAAGSASRTARQITVGANSYPVSYVKYYLNYERTKFEGGAARPTENILLFRAQVAF